MGKIRNTFAKLRSMHQERDAEYAKYLVFFKQATTQFEDLDKLAAVGTPEAHKKAKELKVIAKKTGDQGFAHLMKDRTLHSEMQKLAAALKQYTLEKLAKPQGTCPHCNGTGQLKVLPADRMNMYKEIVAACGAIVALPMR